MYDRSRCTALGGLTMSIVFIRHTNGGQRFLFEAPPGIDLKEGEEVVVQTKNGETVGICVCDSFELDGKALQAVTKVVGAKLPLKPVVGRICVERFGGSSEKSPGRLST